MKTLETKYLVKYHRASNNLKMNLKKLLNDTILVNKTIKMFN